MKVMQTDAQMTKKKVTDIVSSPEQHLTSVHARLPPYLDGVAVVYKNQRWRWFRTFHKFYVITVPLVPLLLLPILWRVFGQIRGSSLTPSLITAVWKPT